VPSGSMEKRTATTVASSDFKRHILNREGYRLQEEQAKRKWGM